MPGKVLQPVFIVFAHLKFGRSLISNYIKLLLCNVFRCDIKGTYLQYHHNIASGERQAGQKEIRRHRWVLLALIFKVKLS